MPADPDSGRRIGPHRPAPVRDWCDQVRELTRTHRLQPRALAARTDGLYGRGEVPRPYSKTSWQRVLAGEVLPPPWAVRVLCAVAGHDPGPWLDRLARATAALDTTAPDRTGPAPDAARSRGPARPGTAATTGRWRSALLATGAALVAGAAGAALVLVLTGGPAGRGAAAPGPQPASPTITPCHAATCRGKGVGVTGCQRDATTLAEAALRGGATVQLRYSRACAAAWANLNHGPAGAVLTLRGPAGTIETAQLPPGNEFLRTRLVDASTAPALRACVDDGPTRVCVDAVPPAG